MDTLQDLVANPSPYMESFGIRSKRETQDLTGFEDFPIPFLGAAVGVKYKDPSDHMKGGEAYFHIDDLQSHIPTAHSKMVKLHVKFDGGASHSDGLKIFTSNRPYIFPIWVKLWTKEVRRKQMKSLNSTQLKN